MIGMFLLLNLKRYGTDTDAVVSNRRALSLQECRRSPGRRLHAGSAAKARVALNKPSPPAGRQVGSGQIMS